MGHSRAIEAAIQKLAGTFKADDIRFYVGEVSSVDVDAATCSVNVGAVTIPDVRLQACVEDGILIEPEKDSDVLLLVSKNAGAYIIMYSKVKRVYIESPNVDISGEITLNSDNFGGLAKVDELAKKYNALEQDLNTLKAVFNSWIPVPGDGGALLKTTASTWSGQALNITAATELENKKVKHGG